MSVRNITPDKKLLVAFCSSKTHHVCTNHCSNVQKAARSFLICEENDECTKYYPRQKATCSFLQLENAPCLYKLYFRACYGISFITKSSNEEIIGTANITIVTFPASSILEAMEDSPASLQTSAPNSAI